MQCLIHTRHIKYTANVLDSQNVPQWISPTGAIKRGGDGESAGKDVLTSFSTQGFKNAQFHGHIRECIVVNVIVMHTLLSKVPLK